VGRTDPDGGWRLPGEIFLVAWVLMAVGYGYSGSSKLVSPSWLDGSALSRMLDNPLARPTILREWMQALPPILLKLGTWGALGLELLYAPLACFRRLRPWIWLAMLALHLGLFALLDLADLTAGMVLLHLLTFDPAWVPPRKAAGPETLFYDGHCGLCHRWVRFVLAEDRLPAALQFAPLQGETFEESTSEQERRGLPDSLVLRTSDRRTLTRSAAVLHLAARLGGYWRVLGAACGLVPRSMRDVTYDLIAGIRHRVFARPVDACPLLPPHLRARFLP
jgi:predicted DCC family thiol-disulfide oxidoreductase YuxK